MSEELPDRLKAILSSESIWEEPPAELEQRIKGLTRGVERPASSRLWRTWLPVVATLAILIVGAVSAFDRPDWEVNLVATEEAPNASAVVMGWNEAEGTRMRFDIRGLPAASPGTYYEIWVTSIDGRHVSGGTFQGDGVLTAMVGVRRGDFPRIWITLEQIDRDSGPSPETYFDSPL